MDPYIRCAVTLPVTLPLLFIASAIDFATAPVSHLMKCDPAKDIAEVAFWIMGV